MADAADNQFGTGAESGGEGASGEEGASSGAKRRMVASLGRSDKDSWGAEEADVRRKQVTGAASGDKSAASSGSSRKRMDGSLAGRSHDKDKDAEEADVRRKQVTGAESGDEGVSQLVPPVKHKKMVTLRTVSLLYRHQC